MLLLNDRLDFVHDHNPHNMRVIPYEAEAHRAGEHKNGAHFRGENLVSLLRHVRVHIEINDKDEQGKNENGYEKVQPGVCWH